MLMKESVETEAEVRTQSVASDSRFDAPPRSRVATATAAAMRNDYALRRASTDSTVSPYFSASTGAGALAPKRSTPMHTPS